MTKEEISALIGRAKASLEETTPGPWYSEGSHWAGMYWADYEVKSGAAHARRVCRTQHGNDPGYADSQFIAQSRTLIPELIAALEALLPNDQ